MQFSSLEKAARWVAVVGALSLTIQLPHSLWSLARTPASADPAPSVRAALAAIADAPAGSKVFHCDWSLGPYLLHDRPDLRFVDVLDPSLLPSHSPSLSRTREALVRGTISDPWLALRREFKADYVICSPETGLADQLAHDPRFKALAVHGPPNSNLRFAAYMLMREAPSLLTHLEIAPLPSSERSDPSTKWEPAPAGSAFLDLRKASRGAQCVAVRPSSDEVARRAGSTMVGLGGGPSVRLWLNGRPLFASAVAPALLRAVDVLVPLDEPLRATDSLEAVVCSPSPSPFFGITLLLLDPKEVDAACGSKAREPTDFQLRDPRECALPIAAH
jgi:hypothetical protein